MGIRKSEFVAKNQFLWRKHLSNFMCQCIWRCQKEHSFTSRLEINWLSKMCLCTLHNLLSSSYLIVLWVTLFLIKHWSVPIFIIKYLFLQLVIYLRPNLKNLNRVAKPPKTGSNWAKTKISKHLQYNFKWNQPCLRRGSNSLNSASGVLLKVIMNKNLCF